MSDGAVEVTEGRATLYFPSQKGVFYNPPQIPNRDLSVLALRRFAEMRQQELIAERAKKAEKAAARAAAAAPAAPVVADDDAAAGSSAPVDEAAAAAVPATDASAAAKPAAVPATDASAAAKPAADEPPPPGLRVLDALSASGLRAMRYIKEVAGVRQVVANDLDPVAVATMQENFRRNGVGEPQVVSNTGDAVTLLHLSKPPAGERFDVVDLDPYGTAAPFLDAGVQAVAEGGMLMVTCTDLAVLAGTYPEACYAKYGAFPMKAKYCHEAALRIVLGCVEAHANRHRRYIVPLLSVHINFYVRLFVRVYTSPGEVKKSPAKQAYLFQCSGCEAFALQPVGRIETRDGAQKFMPAQGPPVARACAHCGRPHHVGGPLWAAPMHDAAFVASLLEKLHDDVTPAAAEANGAAAAAASTPGATVAAAAPFASKQRLVGMLTSCAEELPDVPLFYQLAAMCNTLKIQCPPLVSVVSALMRQNFRVSRSHTDANCLKTDAPPGAVWDVMRCWAADHPPKNLHESSPGKKILATPPATAADFSKLPAAEKLLNKRDASGAKVGRFLPNPAEWGPGARGKSHAALGTHGAEAAAAPAAEGADAAADAAADATVAVKAEGETAAMATDGSDAGAAGHGGDSMLEKRARNQGKKSRKRQAPGADADADANGGADAGEGEAAGGEGEAVEVKVE